MGKETKAKKIDHTVVLSAFLPILTIGFLKNTFVLPAEITHGVISPVVLFVGSLIGLLNISRVYQFCSRFILFVNIFGILFNGYVAYLFISNFYF